MHVRIAKIPGRIPGIGRQLHSLPQAALQAVQATIKGKALYDVAKKKRALAAAIDKWGVFSTKTEDKRPTYTYRAK